MYFTVLSSLPAPAWVPLTRDVEATGPSRTSTQRSSPGRACATEDGAGRPGYCRPGACSNLERQLRQAAGPAAAAMAGPAAARRRLPAGDQAHRRRVPRTARRRTREPWLRARLARRAAVERRSDLVPGRA